MENKIQQLYQKIDSVKELKRWLKNQKSIVIYGAGDYGTRLVDYMFSIEESLKIEGIVVTKKEKHNEYRGINIWTANDFFIQFGQNPVIIAVSIGYQKDIIQLLRQFGQQYYCMTEELYMSIKRRLMDPRSYVSYQGIDFLCPGFGKCGTTSLYSALRCLKNIYLPEHKENHFLEWCDDMENAEELLIENFYDNIREGQKVGMIDPTYAWEAKKTRDCFGDRLKIVFLVRNPVDAAFSGFKMAARQGRGMLDLAYKKNGGVFSVEIFEEHFKKDKDRFRYIEWIQQFEKYYSREQLKVIFLEELISEPQVVINDVLAFIGVSERYECKQLPVSNKGGFVMADLEGYQLARQRLSETIKNWNMCLYGVRKENENTKEELEERYAHALKIYDVYLTKEQRKKTELYYNSSVRELEGWLNKNLSKIWF